MPSKRKKSYQIQEPRKRPSLDTVGGVRVGYNQEDIDDFYGDDNTQKSASYTSGPINVDTGQRSAFPVATEDDDDDMENPPLNAMDYLRRVTKEANTRPSLVYVQRPQKPRVVQFGGRTLKSYADSGPETTVPPIVQQPAKPIIETTSLTVDASWYRSFLTTYSHAKLALSKLPKTSFPHKYSGDMPQTASKWREFFLNAENTPTVSLVKSFDHELLFKLIRYGQKWMSASMSPLLSRWIYALLVRLPETLMGEEIAILRELAKKCILIRKNPSQSLTPTTQCCLDMTVCVVAGFYSQKDLIKNQT